LSKRIQDVSGGEIVTKYFAAGEKVGAFDAFDEVASGNSQAYHAADYYWKGKHPGWAFFTSVPFGLTYTENAAWIHHMGGQQLWDELASGFGLKCLAAGNTGVQMGGWFKKEINSPEDLKGLKMRIPGLGGDVMAKVGVSPVSLSGGQIYENLMSGAIEATEWVGPWNDYAMKFYEATKYYYYPGMHEPGGFNSLGLNAKFWNDLSETHKAVITACAHEHNDYNMAEYNANNGKFLTKLIEEHGVKVRMFNDDLFDVWAKGSEEVYNEIQQHSDLAKRIFASFSAARADVGRWKNLSEGPYFTQRNRALGITND
jgi:TRAP-type mannitol/chloroaromatic compound transport system substrate-binding protein